jgi:hypothetical protein
VQTRVTILTDYSLTDEQLVDLKNIADAMGRDAAHKRLSDLKKAADLKNAADTMAKRSQGVVYGDERAYAGDLGQSDTLTVEPDTKMDEALLVAALFQGLCFYNVKREPDTWSPCEHQLLDDAIALKDKLLNNE